MSDTAADLLTSTSRGGHRPSDGGKGSSAKGSSVTGGHHVTGLNTLSSCQTLHLVKQPMKQKQSESREVWKDRIVNCFALRGSGDCFNEMVTVRKKENYNMIKTDCSAGLVSGHAQCLHQVVSQYSGLLMESNVNILKIKH